MATTKIPTTLRGGGNQEPELLTVKEACEQLRISTWSFYRLIQRRQLPSLRIGRRRFVTAEAIRKFIQQRSEEPA